MNQYRNILIAATNECLKNGLSLDPSEDPANIERKEFLCILFGEMALVSYEYHSWDEVYIRVKWSLSEIQKHGCRLIVGAWLERRTGVWLQGKGGDYIGRDYVGRGVSALIKTFPPVQPDGYAPTGKFYF